MNLVENVFEIAESFINKANYVKMNYEAIERISEDIKNGKKPVFDLPRIDDQYKTLVLELVASSINYCYWYGRYDIRPNGANSTYMYELLMNSFYDFENPDNLNFSLCIERFIQQLSINRFPLLEERSRHLRELKNGGLDYLSMIQNKYQHNIGEEINMNYLLNELIILFPGFTSDIFLKRASLFFIELYRRFGWFDDELKELHVPADYQIPKMLEYFNCIEYSPTLKQKITDNVLIPKHSVEECEIRAATIMTMKKFCELTGWNVADIDTYFFTKRHLVTTPFHLTITTDY